jgi:alpha-aminoadipic semialdehyde synthase
MLELRDRAEASGIRILNEIGLDPGLDHCSAMKIIDDIRDRGGCVTTFESVCGGLPAPEAANNPLRYKFSWSPRGVISASQNDARYLRDGRLISVRGNELLANATPFTDSFTDLDLECLPNRDSLNYQRTYGIDKARTIFRGTLRYSGFSSLMHVFRSIGLLDTHTLIDGLRTWDDVVTALSRNRGGFTSVDDFFLACCGEDDALTQRTAEALAWLGIHGKCAHEAIQKKLNDRTIVDLFCDRLEERLKFGPAERDMVVMHHKIGAEFDNGAVEEHHSSLQVFGTESTMTAMCRTVGFPVAAAADLILRGDLDDCAPGLLLPTSRAMYIPILDAVKKEGINFEEHCLYGSSCVTEQKVM